MKGDLLWCSDAAAVRGGGCGNNWYYGDSQNGRCFGCYSVIPTLWGWKCGHILDNPSWAVMCKLASAQSFYKGFSHDTSCWTMDSYTKGCISIYGWLSIQDVSFCHHVVISFWWERVLFRLTRLTDR
jgi:hypothetical protein